MRGNFWFFRKGSFTLMFSCPIDELFSGSYKMKFNVGDRVRIYGHGTPSGGNWSKKSTVIEVFEDRIKVKGIAGWCHPNQCRRLVMTKVVRLTREQFENAWASYWGRHVHVPSMREIMKRIGLLTR